MVALSPNDPGARQGRGSPYDRFAAAYELIADAAEHRARDRGLDVLGARQGETILEIGAGTGRAMQRIAGEVGPTGLAFGLDSSAGMLRLARARLLPFPRTSLVRGDARAAPFPNRSLDAVFMSFTLELFDGPGMSSVLAETRRMLRAGGRLALVCLDERSPPSAASRSYTWLRRRFPAFIDCRPIDALGVTRAAGFVTARSETLSLWGLPARSLLAFPDPSWRHSL